MPRLNKFDVEALLDDYDRDPIAALSLALAKVLDRPGEPWADLVAAAPLGSERRQALLRLDQTALDDLLRELNEQRSL